MNIEVLVVVANKDEFLFDSLSIVKEFQVYGVDVYKVYLKEIPITIAVVGTGLSIVYEKFEKLIKLYSSVLVLNIGIAGSAKWNIGNIIVSNKAFVPTVEIRNEGRLSDCLFDWDNNLDAMLQLHRDIMIGSIVSSENFVCRKEQVSVLGSWDCFDMEAAAIYNICRNYGHRCYFFKYITDRGEGDAECQVQNNIGRARETLYGLLEEFIQYLSR